MIFEKRYLQFNDLVFDSYDMISSYDADVSFKSNTTEYSYGHGSYAPLKNPYMMLREASVSMTLTLKLKKIPCEDRAFYVRFAEEELAKVGRLWAVKNNELIWAYAYITNLSQVITMRKDEVTYDIEFILPEGIWHKADKLKTFLAPYNPCIFMECKGYKVLDPCASIGVGCCDCVTKPVKDTAEDCYCCCVDEITSDMALCNHMGELQDFYSCETPYQIIYSCTYAEKFLKDGFLGQRLCAKDVCQSIIAGQFYSETDIPTTEATITIRGNMKDAEVTINGNTNVIKGEYEGYLRIEPNGDVYHGSADGCCETLLDPSVWSVPNGSAYGWTIQPRNNSIIVNMNNCCSETLPCVWIDIDNITI